MVSFIAMWRAIPPAAVPVIGGQIVSVEHSDMITIHFSVAADKNPRLAEVWREGNGTAVLSVPATWTLRGVEGGLLGDVSGAPEKDGYRAHALPEGARLSFLLPVAQDIVVFNGSRAALLVKWKIIGLEKGTVHEDSVLMKDIPVVLR